MAHMLSDIELADLSVGTERKATNGVPTQPVLYTNDWVLLSGCRNSFFILASPVSAACRTRRRVPK